MLTKKRIFPAQAMSSFVILGLISLMLVACGDSTATPAPAPTVSAVTTAAAPTAAPATTAPVTTAVATTLAPTTAATTSAPVATNTPAPTTIAATSPAATPSAGSLPYEFVLKYDTTANRIDGGGVMGLDGQGNLYVLDRGNTRIQKYDPNGKFVTLWGKKGNGDGEFKFRPSNPKDGPDAGFLAVDKEGNVYVSDGYNARIQKFDSNGQFLTKWDNLSLGTGQGQSGTLTVGPISVAADNSVYFGVSDFNAQTNEVQKFDSNGKFIARFGSWGSKEGQFSGAAGSIVDKQGNIYVADLLNSRVQKLDSKFNFLLAFGTEGKADGQLARPVTITQDSQGNLYVADNSTRLQKFDPSGKFLGKLTSDDITTDKFDSVATAIIDKDDNLYVSFTRSTNTIQIYKYRIKKP